jgi:twitching motility protein PilU
MDLSMNMRAFVAQQLIPTPDGKGRRAAVEILLNSPLVADLIRDGEVHKIKEVMKKSREEGMQTFDQALYDLYRSEAITYEDALHHADSANDLRLMIKLGDEEASESMGSSLEGVSFTDTTENKGTGFGGMSI